MGGVLHGLLTAPPLLVYVLVGLLVFGEAAVFAGFVLPGETAVVLGGVIASRQGIDLRVLIVLVVVSAIVGDSVGYEVGRAWGARVLRLRPLRRHEQRLDRARTFLRERGAFAVFLGRWTAFLRAVMPGLAGVSRMPYRRFLVWNAVGVVVGLVVVLQVRRRRSQARAGATTPDVDPDGDDGQPARSADGEPDGV